MLTVGALAENCYIIHENNKAIIIDPGDEADRIMSILQEKNLHLEKILLTHAHYDHIGAVDILYEKLKPEIFLHKDDNEIYFKASDQANYFGLPDLKVPDALTPIEHNDEIIFEDYSIKVLHTPGHSPGSVCFHFVSEDFVFTGDTLFKHAIGRTDLPGGDSRKIIPSIKNNLFKLNDDCVVYPGHMMPTTILEEKTNNPFFGTNMSF